MSKTQRAIAIGTVILLAALGTGWTLEKGPSHRRAGGAAAVSDSPTTISPAASTPESTPPAPIPSEEYDRSDLLLSQG